MDFPDSCTIAPFVSDDGFDSSYGVPVPSECYYNEGKEINNEGSNQIISAWIGFPPETTIADNSRITLEDGSQPPIVKIRHVKRLSDNEVDYIRVLLGVSGEKGGI